MVARSCVFLALPLAAGEPNEVRVLFEQVHDVAVRELRRVAHAFRRHAFDARLVGFLRGGVGKHHAPAQLREEGEPERVVFIHRKRARNAHGAARGGVGRERLVVEQAMALVFEQVGHVALLVEHACALLAAVARDEAAVLAGGFIFAEVVHGKQAVVRAGLAAHGFVRGGQGLKRGGAEHGSVHVGGFARALGCAHGGLVAIARQQGRAIGAHVARDVGAHGIHAGELFEGAQHGIVEERATLYDNFRADFFGVANFNDLEQGVLDNGNGQARGDIAHGCAFFLSLLHTGVHEYGAAAAQIDRIFGGVRGFRELGHVEVQARSEAFDEAAAARRACLVEHDMVDNAVFHAQALHVLAADVENELDARQHFLCAAKVRDGFDFAGVDAQRLEQQALAVASYGCMPNGDFRLAVGCGGQRGVHFGDRALGGAQNVALVVGVEGPQKAAVFADEGRFERGGAGVDAQVGYAFVGGKVGALHLFGCVARFEFVEFGFVGEQRRQAHDFAALNVAQAAQAFEHVGKQLGRGGFLAAQSGAARDEQVGVLRANSVLIVEIQRFAEAFIQLREILQRAAEQGDVATNGTAAREARNGLCYDGLENGGRDVFFAGAFVQKRLHVGFGEHAAAARDGVNGGVTFCELVQAASVGVEQGRHLVDERARAAGAGAVHALFDAVVEVDDFRVFAAELDDDVGLRNEGLNGGFACDDLLNEVDAEPLREQKAARAGDGDGHGRCRVLLGRLAHHFHDGRANVGVVAAIARVQNLVVVVEHGHLHRGGAYVDANVERRLARGACGGLRFGGDCLLVVGFSHVGPLLHFDGFARLDEQQAHRDKCHFFGGLGHS